VPIDDNELFAGRISEFNKVIDAINQQGQHVIVYGERGVGKTSLANVLSSRIFSRAGHQAIAPRVNCDATDTFSSLWQKVLAHLTMINNEPTLGFTGEVKQKISTACGMVPDPTRITPEDIRNVLSTIGRGSLLLVIFDEFDRLPDGKDRRAMADTIKTLSDYAVPVTVVLVGVAETVGELIAEHESIERALAQVPMPRMASDELEEILEKGTTKLGMGITDAAKSGIATLSQGFPSYTHRLGLHAARYCAENGRMTIKSADVSAAIQEAVSNAQQSLRDQYRKAIASPQAHNLYQEVLLACALAHHDQFGYFKPADVAIPMSEIMARPYEIPSFAKHLKDFCEEGHGGVLKREGAKRKYQYRFTNPLLQPFIVMKGIVESRIDPRTFLSTFLSDDST
jgi:Cdc6-like AAA superfamily ATPase